MKLTLDLSNRLLRGDQEAQYRPAVRLRNDFENRFHSLDILHGAYACQGIYRHGARVTRFNPSGPGVQPRRNPNVRYNRGVKEFSDAPGLCSFLAFDWNWIKRGDP